ncbi:holo-ACP synthase [Streptomyces sp. NRRL B-24572]|uniref:holo-ACP synthase n=1 Tax=Streptomyces sp. NRRL B-24572 TaxID=1962156 RepID=UPI000A3C583A|nr:holo-ACP synthase [Streptomyces sp. NRRL B-24572]
MSGSGCDCRPPLQLGIDVLRIGSLAKTMRHDRFLRHLYAPEELAHAESLGEGRREEFLYGRFAAKEAIVKVLGVGLFGDAPPHEIAVLRNAKGAPEPVLRGRAAHCAEVAGIASLTLSISHTRELAAAAAAGWRTACDCRDRRLVNTLSEAMLARTSATT